MYITVKEVKEHKGSGCIDLVVEYRFHTYRVMLTTWSIASALEKAANPLCARPIY